MNNRPVCERRDSVSALEISVAASTVSAPLPGESILVSVTSRLTDVVMVVLVVISSDVLDSSGISVIVDLCLRAAPRRDGRGRAGIRETFTSGLGMLSLSMLISCPFDAVFLILST